MTFNCNLEKQDENMFTVFFPDLPNVMTFGTTHEHAVEMAQEALEVLKKAGHQITYEEMDIMENKIEAFSRQIVSAPSIEIGDEVVFRGQLPSKDELLAEIEKRA